jgi:hypothetical protein
MTKEFGKMNQPQRNRPGFPGMALFVFGLLLVGGCHTFRLNSPVDDKPAADASAGTPNKTTFRISQYVFYADFPVNRHLPIFSDLANLRDHVHKELQLPTANTIVHVYLFENRERYLHFMRAKYPDLPVRRAFFVAQPRGMRGTEDLLVYTYWGDRIEEDLRHELTHALLHSVLRDVPLWLDEGLAEYFEVPARWKGVNYRHLDQLRSNDGASFRPDLVRLEQLKEVQDMAPSEYREAWAWVHFMLHNSAETKNVLVKYLRELRTNTDPGKLRPRLAEIVPGLDSSLERHLTHLDGLARPQTVQHR